jgi:hypothetical protein
VCHLGLHGRAVAGLRDKLEVDLDASILALDRLGVEVPTAVVTGGAGVEGGRLSVGEEVVLDGESSIGFGAFVALLLRGGRSQDAAAVLVVVDVWMKRQWMCCRQLGRCGNVRPVESIVYLALGIGRLVWLMRFCPSTSWPTMPPGPGAGAP